MTSQGGLPERPAGPAGPRLAKGIPLSTAIVIVALSALVAGAAVVVAASGGSGTDDRIDRFSEPFPCNEFSDEVLDELGGEGELTGPLPGLHRWSQKVFCSWDGLSVHVSTFTGERDGDGSAAALGELAATPGPDPEEVEGIADGAMFDRTVCYFHFVESNVLVTLIDKEVGDVPCREELTSLAQDFARHNSWASNDDVAMHGGDAED